MKAHLLILFMLCPAWVKAQTPSPPTNLKAEYSLFGYPPKAHNTFEHLYENWKSNGVAEESDVVEVVGA